MSEDGKVEPALTPEEWAPGPMATGPRCDEAGDEPVRIEGGMVWRRTRDEGEQPFANPHGVAALCLHGQPFGFTQDDVAALGDAASSVAKWLAEHGYPHERIEGDAACTRLRSLATRIAALLPPPPAASPEP